MLWVDQHLPGQSPLCQNIRTESEADLRYFVSAHQARSTYTCVHMRQVPPIQTTSNIVARWSDCLSHRIGLRNDLFNPLFRVNNRVVWVRAHLQVYSLAQTSLLRYRCEAVVEVESLMSHGARPCCWKWFEPLGDLCRWVELAHPWALWISTPSKPAARELRAPMTNCCFRSPICSSVSACGTGYGAEEPSGSCCMTTEAGKHVNTSWAHYTDLCRWEPDTTAHATAVIHSRTRLQRRASRFAFPFCSRLKK